MLEGKSWKTTPWTITLLPRSLCEQAKSSKNQVKVKKHVGYHDCQDKPVPLQR
jgi:hypothetical protein